MTRERRLAAAAGCLAALATATAALAQVRELTPDEQSALAVRFAPYIRTTTQNGDHEPSHPTNWDWFVRRSTMVRGYQHDDGTSHGCAGQGTWDSWPNGDVVQVFQPTSDPASLLSAPCADLSGACETDAGGNPIPRTPSAHVDHHYALHLNTDGDRRGEDWNAVANEGHGIYAHVEEIAGPDGLSDTDLVNIEYSILWAYNDAYCSHHHGDITTMTVVYDRAADLLTRITYSVHGDAILSFRLSHPNLLQLRVLTGQDDDGHPQSMNAARLWLFTEDQYQQGSKWHSPGDTMVELAQDPTTKRYEHPVAYAEFTSHELWPNVSGKLASAPAHGGDGFAFLPAKVQVLGTVSHPNLEHAPFLFFNGKFGTDPNSIMMHRSWYWPGGRPGNPFAIPPDAFTDQDPYIDMTATMTWPPMAEFVGAAPTLYVSRLGASQPVIGDPKAPFPDLAAAWSFAPCGATVSIDAGAYPGPWILDRQCGGQRGVTVMAPNGVVTLGSP